MKTTFEYSRETIAVAKRLSKEFDKIEKKANDPNRRRPVDISRRVSLEMELRRRVFADLFETGTDELRVGQWRRLGGGESIYRVVEVAGEFCFVDWRGEERRWLSTDCKNDPLVHDFATARKVRGR